MLVRIPGSNNYVDPDKVVAVHEQGGSHKGSVIRTADGYQLLSDADTHFVMKALREREVLRTANELVLAPDQDSLWITVRNVSVRIGQNKDGVCVSMFPLGAEDDPAMAETEVLYADAAEES